MERERADKDREWERERTLHAVSTPVVVGAGGGEQTVERTLVQSLQLVPEFDEDKVAEWFVRFERKAKEFAWSRERWVGLVANKLKGKALEVYDKMSADDLDDYNEFKADILRAYELRPEAYRLQFRGKRKRASDSYLECARSLEQVFERWIASEGVDSLEALKELLVMEQFIDIADKELVPLLREKRFRTLKEAATWADDYVLAHRPVQQPGSWSRKEGGPKGGPGSGGSSSSGSPGHFKRYSRFGSKMGLGKPQAPTPPSSAKDGTAGKAAPKTPKYDYQPMCYHCRGKGHFKFNCPKLVTAETPKSSQKPVALLVWPDQVSDDELTAPSGLRVEKARRVPELCLGEGEQVGPPVPPPVAMPALRNSELDWCRPFLCGGTVEIDGTKYPITVLRDTGAQQSVCRNVTGRKVTSSKAVLCRGLNTVEEFVTAEVTLSCPLVTATARVAVADELPVAGVDFLLGNDLAGGRVWIPTSDEEEVAEESGQVMQDSVNVVTRSQARRAEREPVTTQEAASSQVGLTPDGSSSADVVEPALGSPLSSGVEADGDGVESPVNAPDSALGSVAESEDGVLGVAELFDGYPHSAEHSGGSTRVEWLPGVDAEGSDVQHRSQHDKSGSLLEVGAQDGETSSYAGELRVSPPVEHSGGRERAVPLPGDCLAGGDDPSEDSPDHMAGAEKPGPALRPRCRVGRRVAALPQPHDPIVPFSLTQLEPAELICKQQEDPALASFFARVGEGSEELEGKEEFVLHQGVLCRRWQESDGGELLQVVVPHKLREALVLLAHEGPMAGHLGIRKTVARLRRNFWWPSMSGEVATILKCCHTCQLVGKPNQTPPVAPLHPIPAVDPPFTRVLIDIVGPLPTTRAGHKYMLTIMDVTTRYPEAIPLRSTHSKVVLKALLTFFTHFGLPAELQSDQGTNFTSKLFNDTMTAWGIKHIVSSAYHPQSQGALERHHQTLKTMLKSFCMERDKDWDEGVPYVLFAVREAPTESLGFSPNQLVFGHRVRGPLDVVREAWCQPSPERPVSLLKSLMSSRERLAKALEVAQTHLCKAQQNMKGYYDRRAEYRSFAPGDEVLVLLPLQGQPLAARYSGPYVIEKKVGDLDYLVVTPDRRKRAQLCHVNMLKPYFRSTSQKGSFSSAVQEASSVLFFCREGEAPEVIGPEPVVPTGQWERNSFHLLREKVAHLGDQQNELLRRLRKYSSVFSSVPGRTQLIEHDIDVGDAEPVKLPPYRVNPMKQALVEKELEYMLEHGLITRTYSQWSSPVTLQPKPDGKVRFCIDFRRVNALTKVDTYPLPRVDDSVDRIGSATFITKVDLVKGYWQVPLTERAKEIASFVANGAVYQCQVMPYGLRNAPATFQRLMDRVTDGLTHCVVYIDDVVIYDTTWAEHLTNVEALFARLQEAGLVVNLEKCEFVQARVQYLGYRVGHGYITPPEAKVEAIRQFPAPTCRRALQRFLGVVGYYRRFVPGYSTLLAPLTDLLQKGRKWAWSKDCESAFQQVKSILCEMPVLQAPDFRKSFALAVDASQVGVGAVLLQPDDQGVNHPVCYFSKKFTPAQKNYSVIEQELLAILLALQHFEIYIPAYGPQVVIYSDHSPLQFLEKFKFKNQRLTRWSLLLQEYNILVRHIKGADNVVADCLSRGHSL